MRKLWIICLLQTVILTAFAAHWDDEIWTDGMEMLCTRRLNDTQVLLVGQAYMDSNYGYLLEIEDKGKGNYDLTQLLVSQLKSIPDHLGEEERSIIESDMLSSATAGNKWKRRCIGSYDLLMRYDSKGKLCSIYLQSGREMTEEGEDAIRDLLVGSYTSRHGKNYTFTSQDLCTWNDKPDISYMMVADGEYGSPSCHFIVQDQQYEFSINSNGLHVYKTEHHPEAPGPSTGALIAELSADRSQPRWAFLSHKPLLLPALYAADKELLRLMRNEIFARHGYRFANPQLRAYFEACHWYHPVADNSQVKLSDLEQLNVELLKNYE